jgi:hypothetical protein
MISAIYPVRLLEQALLLFLSIEMWSLRKPWVHLHCGQQIEEEIDEERRKTVARLCDPSCVGNAGHQLLRMSICSEEDAVGMAMGQGGAEGVA